MDVSGLDVDAGVAASLSSAGAGGINFGSGAGVSAARHVATVKAGIKFDISHANQLYCSGEGATQPSLKVTEGFASAWEFDPDGFGSTMVHFKILNVPSGVTFIWPGQKHDDAESNPEARKNLIAWNRQVVSPTTMGTTVWWPHLNSCRLVCRPTPRQRSTSSWRWIMTEDADLNSW